MYAGGIVFRLQFCQVVNRAVDAVAAVLGQGIIRAVAPLVCFPGIDVLGVGLAPCESSAVILWNVCTYISRRPQCAAGESQFNPFINRSIFTSQDDFKNYVDVGNVDRIVSIDIGIGSGVRTIQNDFDKSGDIDNIDLTVTVNVTCQYWRSTGTKG